jgi:hypothetical protein
MRTRQRPFSVEVEANASPADVCVARCVSIHEVAYALGSYEAAFRRSAERQSIVLPPQIAAPCFPAGPRARGVDVVEDLDFPPDYFGGSAAELGLLQASLRPPLAMLRHTVEEKAAEAESSMALAQDGVISVDVGAISQERQRIARSFAENLGHMATLSASALGLLASRHARRRLPPASMRSGGDENTSTLAGAAVEYELEVTDRNSLTLIKERWLVLGTQSISTWMNAFDCLSDALPFPQTGGSFLFLAATFVAEDASDVAHVRDWTSAEGQQLFAECHVRDPQTRFEELALRVGDRGVLRHCGHCDHIITVVNIHLQRNARPGDYPRRCHSRAPRPTYCDVCRGVAATIMTHFDPLAPTHPALYCVACFRLLHGDAALDPDAERDFVCFRLPPGKHF